MLRKTLEKVIRKRLKGDAQENALAFAAFMRANGMRLERTRDGYWGDKPYWLVKYKGELVCSVFVHGSPAIYEDEPEGWLIWTDSSGSKWYEDAPLDGRMKEIAWQHVDTCGGCNPDGPCFGGHRKTVFGKEFEHVCITVMLFINPDAEALECLKKLLELRQNDILKEAP